MALPIFQRINQEIFQRGDRLGGVTQHCMEIAPFSSVLIERYFRGAIALVGAIVTLQAIALFPDALIEGVELIVGWVSDSVTHAGVGFRASTQPT